MKLYLGDCLDVMRGMDADSVDAIVTDPPYGLSFMGKAWDGPQGMLGQLATGEERRGAFAYGGSHSRGYKDNVPAVFYEWCLRWATEALRVAKPGAHLLAFGGTRTWHRLSCAIEDAGWEIRDTVMWVYGCLSDDTEIMLEGRWVPYHSAVVGRRVLCYNVGSDTYEWQPIQEVYTYAYADTAYRIYSDRTDQLVSRNHRCLVERDGALAFEFAEEAAREHQARVPVLEDMRGLLQALPLPDERAGDTEPDVLTGVQRQEDQPSQDGQAVGQTGGLARGALRSVWPGSECSTEGDKQEPADVLQSVVSGQGPRWTSDSVLCERQGKEASGHGAGRGGQPGLEGRGDVLSQARQLQARQVCEMPAGLPADGAEGRLCDGASAACCPGNGAAPAALRGSTPQEPRSSGQSARQSGTVLQQPGAQVVRGAGYTTSTLATVTPVHYEGVVWCVRVPSGAFVARRNGKVFVTGNSGFPKSLDVSKAIDKAAGAEREVVGQNPFTKGRKFGQGHNEGWERPWMSDPEASAKHLTAPATAAARQWSGWGTALKPAFEPIIVARKPLQGTVAANVLAWGTGALNVDGCRVEGAAGNGVWGSSQRGSRGVFVTGHSGYRTEQSPLGRWPANLIHDGSEEVLALMPESSITGNRSVRSKAAIVAATAWATDNHQSTEYADSGSAARFFYCAKASKADRDEGLDGMEERHGGTETFDPRNRDGVGQLRQPLRRNGHPTVKPTALMRYLCRLVTPPGGVVLDPFTGSGSTGKAAVLEGFGFVGIELEPEYLDIAERRIAEAQQQMRLPMEATV